MNHNKLDLLGVACPMNFVKTKLFIDKMQRDDIVSVLLDAGEPVESVSTSILQEGHKILSVMQEPEGYFCLTIQKQ